MTKRRIGDDDRLEAFLAQLVANHHQVRDVRRFTLDGMRHVRAIDENDVARLLALRERLRCAHRVVSRRATRVVSSDRARSSCDATRLAAAESID